MPGMLARAKVNLCLHVGGVRRDGLHEVFSLAVFPKTGDIVAAEEADALSLRTDGPFAGELAGLDPEKNLVMRAARLLQRQTGCDRGAAITLTKQLPSASGIGGGTADAAAALIVLRDLWGLALSDAALSALSFRLGADGPLCLYPYLNGASSAVATGAGEHVAPGPKLPPLWICLVNPRRAVPTGGVFRLFDAAGPDGPLEPAPFASSYVSAGSLAAMLRGTRNDLARPAKKLCPMIAMVTEFLEAQPGCVFSRMSGSGATCFGLFNSRQGALKAATAAGGRGWWGASASL